MLKDWKRASIVAIRGMLPGRIVCSLPNVSRLVERARASVRILKEAVAKLALALDEQGRIACAKVGSSVRRGATSMWTVLPVRRDLRQDAVVGKNVLARAPCVKRIRRERGCHRHLSARCIERVT